MEDVQTKVGNRGEKKRKSREEERRVWRKRGESEKERKVKMPAIPLT